jgi:hypothetical protein
MTLLLQISGLVLLIAGIFVGYRQWIKPHRDELDWRGVGLLLLLDWRSRGRLAEN